MLSEGSSPFVLPRELVQRTRSSITISTEPARDGRLASTMRFGRSRSRGTKGHRALCLISRSPEDHDLWLPLGSSVNNLQAQRTRSTINLTFFSTRERENSQNTRLILANQRGTELCRKFTGQRADASMFDPIGSTKGVRDDVFASLVVVGFVSFERSRA